VAHDAPIQLGDPGAQAGGPRKPVVRLAGPVHGITVVLVNLREDPNALREVAGNQGPYHPRY
jgi:hypothetical protein